MKWFIKWFTGYTTVWITPKAHLFVKHRMFRQPKMWSEKPRFGGATFSYFTIDEHQEIKKEDFDALLEDK